MMNTHAPITHRRLIFVQAISLFIYLANFVTRLCNTFTCGFSSYSFFIHKPRSVIHTDTLCVDICSKFSYTCFTHRRRVFIQILSFYSHLLGILRFVYFISNRKCIHWFPLLLHILSVIIYESISFNLFRYASTVWICSYLLYTHRQVSFHS